MSEVSKIEWTDATWNPVTGCTKVSPGCKHCYAETFSERFRGVEGNYFADGFDLQLRPAKLEEPLRWRKPRLIFVNSMSDLFHEAIPVEYIQQVFDVMRRAHWHTFQVLTKRSERMAEVCRDIEIPGNVWLGVSVETQAYAGRVDDLRSIDHPNRFLSCEPLLGPLALDLTGISWVIGGGESGRHLVKHQERRLDQHPEWIRGLRDQCEQQGVAFHFKQWGGANKKKAGRTLDGHTYDDVPGRVRLPIVAEAPQHRSHSLPTTPRLPTRDATPRDSGKVCAECEDMIHPGKCLHSGGSTMVDTGGMDRELARAGIKTKDPKRVAAAHKAWATMRARKRDQEITEQWSEHHASGY